MTVVVELRSVNNRFRDLQVRCPREYLALEPRINNLLKEPFSRGRIDAFIRRSTASGTTTVQVDTVLAKAYLDAIKRTCDALTWSADDIPHTFVLAQPGVLHVTEVEVDVMSEWDVVETAITAGVADLLQMREKEGQALRNDLLSYLDELLKLTDEVESAADGVNERMRNRLETRMRRMLGERFEPQRIMQEAALLADKADVNEEIARLRSHVDQFKTALDGEDAVGRRLDFLLQEMHREVNTIGSKAAEHPMSQRVVEMKTVLERMREQSANVE